MSRSSLKSGCCRTEHTARDATLIVIRRWEQESTNSGMPHLAFAFGLPTLRPILLHAGADGLTSSGRHLTTTLLESTLNLLRQSPLFCKLDLQHIGSYIDALQRFCFFEISEHPQLAHKCVAFSYCHVQRDVIVVVRRLDNRRCKGEVRNVLQHVGQLRRKSRELTRRDP